MNTYEEIYHFGIKGQKWGVRRYQNADGSYTSAGRKRYSIGSAVKGGGIGRPSHSKWERGEYSKPSHNKYQPADDMVAAGRALAKVGGRLTRYQNADGTLTKAGKAKYKKKFDKTKVAKQLGKQHDDVMEQAALIVNSLAGMPYSALANTNLYELIDEDRGLGKKYNEEYTKYVNSILEKKGGVPVKDINFSVDKAFDYGRFKRSRITASEYEDFPDDMTTREYLNSLKKK